MYRQKNKLTIRSWILRLAFVGELIAAILFFAVPWYTGARMRDQALSANEKLSEVYLEFLDSSVEGIGRILSQYATSTYDISVLARSEDEMERYFSKQNLMQKLEDAAVMFHIMDGIFVYSKSDVENTFLCQLGSRGNIVQHNDMEHYMESFNLSGSGNSWNLIRVENRIYLTRVVVTGSTSCGAWISVDSLGIPLETAMRGAAGIVAFLNNDGEVLYSEGEEAGKLTTLVQENHGQVIKLEGGRYLQMTKHSGILPVSVAILIPEAEYMRGIFDVQNVIGLLLAVSLLMFPMLKKILHTSVSKPVEDLLHAMSEVEGGNLDIRVETQGRFLEFDETADYFNNMTTEIKRLQEDVYERQIREQKIQLQYLQTQIRPHFFLNSLNVIHSFSLIGRNDLIEKMTVHLSKYFGYRFENADSFVSLGLELEHVKNYLELHRLRYSSNFTCSIEAEEVLMDAKLPPLVIQTFVENSLKYGMTVDRQFELELIAEAVTEEGEQMLKLEITDNGPGYDKHVLEDAASGRKIETHHGQGIGINNVIQRLHLIYDGRAYVELSNMMGAGACSRIIIPLEFVEENAVSGNVEK